MARRGSGADEALDALDHDALVLLAQIATGQAHTELSFAALARPGLMAGRGAGVQWRRPIGGLVRP